MKKLFSIDNEVLGVLYASASCTKVDASCLDVPISSQTIDASRICLVHSGINYDPHFDPTVSRPVDRCQDILEKFPGLIGNVELLNVECPLRASYHLQPHFMGVADIGVVQ
jgi:hypothetical protein